MSEASARLGHTAAVDTRKKPTATLILVLLGVSYVFNSMDRQAFPALLSRINDEYQLTLAQGGFLSTVFAINIALFGACGAWFMRRFGRRATIVGGMLSYSLFTFLTPLASSFVGLAVYRGLTGAGEALHICAMFSCVGAYFGARRGTAIGIINACFGVGAFLGPVLATMMFAHTDSWRLPFYAFGVGGAIVACIIWLAVPKEFTEVEDTEGLAKGSTAASAGGPVVLFNRNLVMSALAFALVGLSFFAFTALYATYLRTQLGYSVSAAGTLFGLYGIGSLAGFFCGWLGDTLGTRGWIAALAALAAVALLLFHGPDSFAMQAVFSICFGVLVTGYLYPRFMTVLQRNVPAHQVNYAVPVGMVAFYAPGLFAGYVFGRLAELLDWSTASLLVLVLPPLLGVVLTSFYRKHDARGA